VSILPRTLAFAAALLALVPSSLAFAATQNLITNGTFAGTAYGKLGANTLTGWTNNPDTNASGTELGYNFLYSPTDADYTSGTNKTALPLWGTNDGGTNTITAPPGGGQFVGMDGAYEQGSLSQTLNGLTAGTQYYVSFWWAGAQQYSFTSSTTEQFAVALLAGTAVLAGNASCATTGVQCTGVINNPPKGFTGWVQNGFTFTASSAEETLSFLAIGTPGGQPPFSALADVSLQLPEPSSLALLSAAAGLGFLVRRRAKA
jgi:hypothetical protein